SASARWSTSSIRFLRSPPSASLCPGSDPPPASSAACFRPAVAWLLAPRSRPSLRTSPSRRRSCASTPPLPAPRLPPCAPPPVASAPRSSAPPCDCSSTCLFPFPSTKSYSDSYRMRGAGHYYTGLPDGSTTVETYSFRGNWWDGEVKVSGTLLNKHKITLGSEVTDNLRQD